jgi:uncharacterized protein (UPF0262 family)
MTVKIILRNPDGTKPHFSSKSKLPVVVCKIINLESNTPTDIPIGFSRIIARDELEYSYVTPFFDHQIQCSFNQVEVNGSPLQIKLSSVAENLNCSFCGSSAVQAHQASPMPGASSATLYYGVCSRHISTVQSDSSCSRWNKIPQKCNLGLKK